MSLRGAPLLYVFFETTSLPHQRKLFEDGLGLRVIENQFHPPHEYHGLVKYDAGQVILSLNLSKARRFRKDGSDGLITVLDVDDKDAIQGRVQQQGVLPVHAPGVSCTDAWGHHYRFLDPPSVMDGSTRSGSPSVRELCLTVSDLDASLGFYEDILSLTLLEQTDQTARFATGTVDLVLRQGMAAPDGRPVRHHTYLLVFYTADIYEATDALIQRGMARAPRVGTSDIGRTARFIDPSGHVYCLYEPSEESLTWSSGPKVMDIVARRHVPLH